MADVLFDPPPVFDLPLSKGGDLHVTLVYEPIVLDDNGNPVPAVDDNGNPILDSEGNPQYQHAEADWPDGSTVKLVIDSDTPTVVTATIEGSLATVDLDYVAADQIKPRLLWRAVLTHSTGLDEVLANGTTVRKDGKS